MNKLRISLSPVKCPVYGRTNQQCNFEQTIVFRMNTIEVRNDDPSILVNGNYKRPSMSKEQFKRQNVGKLIQSIQHLILYFGPGLKFQVLIPLQF